MKLSKILIAALLLAPACGGGGGGSSSSDSAFTIDACKAIGVKIFGGQHCITNGKPGTTPLVRLVFVDQLGQTGLCTGIALTSNKILSAGHCFRNGITSLRIDTVFDSLSASNIVVHPGYFESPDDGTVFNDVAVVTTSKSVTLSEFPVLTSRKADKGEEAVVAGFGKTSDGEPIGVLEAGNTHVTDVTSNHIFTAFDGTGSNPCEGDSGGPILLRSGDSFAVAGVVSTGLQSKNCQAGDVTLYTSLSSDSVLQFLKGAIPGLPTS